MPISGILEEQKFTPVKYTQGLAQISSMSNRDVDVTGVGPQTFTFHLFFDS